ncbi:hypothetical protein [Kitasatospora kifunensis]|uniref:Uncharacterized protein n=1 Tax=Kitasatospora kifunensis TaxID=58351 RepID=A0A7W7R4Z2_KITKI|nr:hypothetical protein [Kitasatospora kifunensis]MBB4924956.1 hypothetical protein [Kitasatospora kifunensis]
MDTTTYLLNGLLLVTIVRQVRGTELNLANLLIPLGVVGTAAAVFLHSIPTAGHDLTLILALAGIGAVLGALGGSLIRFTPARPKAPSGVKAGMKTKAGIKTGAKAGTKPGLLAQTPLAVLPVLVLGSLARLAFAYGANHALSGTVADFSRDHQITGQNAWVAALVLMALAEVVTRLAVTRLRGHHYRRALTASASPAPAPASAPASASLVPAPASAPASASLVPAPASAPASASLVPAPAPAPARAQAAPLGPA